MQDILRRCSGVTAHRSMGQNFNGLRLDVDISHLPTGKIAGALSFDDDLCHRTALKANKGKAWEIKILGCRVQGEKTVCSHQLTVYSKKTTLNWLD